MGSPEAKAISRPQVIATREPPRMHVRFVVPQDQPELYEYLKARAASQPGIEVIQDRRRVERRQRPSDKWYERRTRERRRPYVIRAQEFIFVDKRGEVIWRVS
jgi:hypothetical protein